jgi:hypothetical protein
MIGTDQYKTVGVKERMTEKQKNEAKQTARTLYQARRISLETAVWAMKNAGYTREETAEWLRLEDKKLGEGY